MVGGGLGKLEFHHEIADHFRVCHAGEVRHTLQGVGMYLVESDEISFKDCLFSSHGLQFCGVVREDCIA